MGNSAHTMFRYFNHTHGRKCMVQVLDCLKVNRLCLEQESRKLGFD